MTLLQASGLQVVRGGRTVLAGVELDLRAGEVLGLIGANGAGKSSLLQALAGLVPAPQGEVRLCGRPLPGWSRRELARTLAYLPQGGACHWPLTVERVVTLGRLPHVGPWARLGPEDRAAVVEAMQWADCLHLRGRRIDTLSGGERARVLLARALAVGPRVLLADEPVAGLDPGHQIQLMRLLRRRAAAGGGVIVVLHDLTLAARFCDRILLLHQGRVYAAGRPQEVLAPAPLVAAFGITAEYGERDGQSYVLPWDVPEGEG